MKYILFILSISFIACSSKPGKIITINDTTTAQVYKYKLVDSEPLTIYQYAQMHLHDTTVCCLEAGEYVDYIHGAKPNSIPAFKSGNKSTDCKSYTNSGWHIVYNKFLDKYAVMRIDSNLTGEDAHEFLLKDHGGEYGIYSAGWEANDCFTCGDKIRSLFDNSCDAKQFLQTYLRKAKEDKWQ